MKMRILVATVAATGALAAWSSGAMALPGDPGTGMDGSAHDGVAGGYSPAMCVECHTPHQAAATMLLWNHDLTSSTFAWDVPATSYVVVLDKRGRVVYTGVGGEQDLDAAIRRAL